MKDTNPLDMPGKLTLSKELEALIDDYEFSYQCAGARVWFTKRPTLAALDELRDFIDELTDDLVKERLNDD